jgi:hypothetical protein
MRNDQYIVLALRFADRLIRQRRERREHSPTSGDFVHRTLALPARASVCSSLRSE